MLEINSICVYCGSSAGKSPLYQEHTKRLAQLLVQDQIQLIYGGGNLGIMGLLARSVHENGGKVLGIIPSALHRIAE